MKTFTARDLNEKRQEIREEIHNGGCIIQFKYANRKVEFETVILPKARFEIMHDALEIRKTEPRRAEVEEVDL